MDQSTATQNFSRWADALLTEDPEQVASLYAKNATLIPTMAERVKTDKAGLLEYFTFFGSFTPTVAMVEEHVVPLAGDSYLHCGVYAFTLTEGDTQRELVARFSMIWQQIDGAWYIFHHHSSQIPTIA